MGDDGSIGMGGEHRWTRLLLSLVLLLGFAVAAACGGRDEPTAPSADESLVSGAGTQHVHGLGVNPADDALYIATHTGLWRAPDGETKASRVGDVRFDLMGFTVVGPDRFLASGHPDAQARELPPHLGLQSSTDGGRSWQTLSLLGEADLHVLRAAGDRLYTVDATSGTFRASADGGRSWEERTAPAPPFDVAIAPGDPEQLVAATEQGLFVSRDTGRTWRQLRNDIAGLLAWPGSGALFLVDGRGAVARSHDGGREFERTGTIGARPEAFAANGPGELYAAVHGGEVRMSTDGGRTWTMRSTP
jgi:hypothetical protein